MKSLKLLYLYCVSILCVFPLYGCEKSSNNEQALKTLKSLEAMMATIEVMDKHNPFKAPYPGLGNPSYYQKMKLNYIEYTKLLSTAQAEINVLKRSKANPNLLKDVQDAMVEFTEIGSCLPFMLTGTGYDNEIELKISLGVKSYDDLNIRYSEACRRANKYLNSAYGRL